MKENDISSLRFPYPFLLPEQQSIQSEFQNEGNSEFQQQHQQHKFEFEFEFLGSKIELLLLFPGIDLEFSGTAATVSVTVVAGESFQIMK